MYVDIKKAVKFNQSKGHPIEVINIPLWSRSVFSSSFVFIHQGDREEAIVINSCMKCEK